MSKRPAPAPAVSRTSAQSLIHFTAGCLDCDASVAARNAQAWAHQHARKTGHSVELSLGWCVSP